MTREWMDRPLCGAAEFDAMVAELVDDEAPRVFAVVQVLGDRVDGRIAAWGMAFGDHAAVVPVDSGSWMSLNRPENALRFFDRQDDGIAASLVWPRPVAGPGV